VAGEVAMAQLDARPTVMVVSIGCFRAQKGRRTALLTGDAVDVAERRCWVLGGVVVARFAAVQQVGGGGFGVMVARTGTVLINSPPSIPRPTTSLSYRYRGAERDIVLGRFSTDGTAAKAPCNTVLTWNVGVTGHSPIAC